MPEYALTGVRTSLPAQHHVASPATIPPGYSAPNWANMPFNTPPPGLGHLPLAAAAVMAPELPRVPFPEQGRWLMHLTPLAAGGLIDAFGMWANSEPNHAWLAALPACVGTVGLLGAILATIAGAAPASAREDMRDNSATRMVAGGGVAFLSLAAMMGTGWSGTGGVGAVATVAGAYVAWANWIGHRRAGNQNVVIALAQAAAAQPHVIAPQPPPGQIMLPGPTNPYEARVLSALEAMGYAGASAGAPQAIGENAWKIRVALPQGRNISPEKIATQVETLASNMQARRAEVEALDGNLIDVTAYDGPDTLGRDYTYPWDGNTAGSLDDAIAIAIDEAGQMLEILINDHLLISGKTGGGKSKLVRLILARTLGARDVVRMGIDCKPGAVELGMFEPSMHYLARSSRDALRAHHGLKALIAERGNLMEEHGADTWDTAWGPKILFASDERAVITRDFPEAGALIEENMQMGRFVGVVFLDATQTPSGSVYGKKTDARHQYGIRIGFYNESTVNTMVFGGKASSEGWRLEKLQNAPGKMLIRCYGHNTPRPYKSLWAERAQIMELLDRFDGTWEPLDARSAGAFAAGMDAFDEQEDSSPPPSGGKRSRSTDPIDAAQEFHYSRPYLVRKFPDGSAMNEARALLWDAIGEFKDGFTYRDVVALDLPGYGGGRPSIQGPLDIWRARGWVTELERRGNTTVFMRCVTDDDRFQREA